MAGKLQCPRPAPLMVSKNSSKIKKTAAPNQGRSSPVIVYLKSPDIIHVRPEDFMGTVQRLTGKAETFSTTSSSSPPTSCVPWLAADHHETMKMGIQDLQEFEDDLSVSGSGDIFMQTLMIDLQMRVWQLCPLMASFATSSNTASLVFHFFCFLFSYLVNI